MKKDQENGTSCKPRSVFRDLEILRRENRGTDIIDDAENQIVASIHVRSNVHQENSRSVVTTYRSRPEANTHAVTKHGRQREPIEA